MKRAVLVALILWIMASCEPESPTSPKGLEPRFTFTNVADNASIFDGAHNGGNPHFFFLPPLVRQPAFAGTFDASLLPQTAVEVCALTGAQCANVIVRFTADGSSSERLESAGKEHYHVVWHTGRFKLDLDVTYRVRVLVAGAELGHADVDVVGTEEEFAVVDKDKFAAVVNGRTLPIQFRIEEGAVFVVDRHGGTVIAADGTVTLGFPDGALSGPTGVTVLPVEDPARFPQSDRLVPGTVFQLGPEGLEFSTPLRLTLTYDPSRLPSRIDPAKLTIHKIVNGQWHEAALSNVSVKDHKVSGEIVSFSMWGLLEGLPVAAAAVTGCNQTNTITSGAGLTCSATPMDGSGSDLYRPVTGNSSDPNVVRVEPKPRKAGSATAVIGMRALAPGTATVTVSSEGASVPLRVVVPSALSPKAPEKIAFSDGGIWMVNPDGSNRERLAEGGRPALSPDARRIAFDREGSLWIMNLDGTGLLQLTHPAGGCCDLLARWSPDGHRVAFDRQLPGTPRVDIYAIDVDGTGLTPLVVSAFETNGYPTWSPDGTLLAYSRMGEVSDEIFVLDLTTRAVRQIASPGGHVYGVSWSRDGRRIAFAAFGIVAGGIYLIDPEGGNLVLLASGEFFNPAWAPDGRALVFSEGESPHLLVMNADGSGVRPLTDGCCPSWAGGGSTAPEPTTTTIGPAGGVALSADQQLRIQVPPGAFDADETIEIGAANESELRSAFASTELGRLGGIIVGAPYTIRSTSAQLRTPAKLTFTLDPSVMPGNDESANLIVVGRLESGSFVMSTDARPEPESPSVTTDRVSSSITALGDGFSTWFAVRVDLGFLARAGFRIGDYVYQDLAVGAGAAGPLQFLRRRDPRDITQIVIHSTMSEEVNDNLAGIAGWTAANAPPACDPAPCVAHYYVGRDPQDGIVLRMYDEGVIATHTLSLNGFSNERSVGIEFVQHVQCTLVDTHKNCKAAAIRDPVAFTEAQYAALRGLICDVADRYAIKSHDAIGLHYKIDPDRKLDPLGLDTDSIADLPEACEHIAFVSDRRGNFDLWSMEPDGTHLRILTEHPAADGFPRWSPDRNKIAFASDRSGNSEIYVMNNDGTDVTRLTNNAAFDSDPTWSPNGKQIAFVSDRASSQHIKDIWVMNADGSDLRNITGTPSIDEDGPDWSPDGARIAFQIEGAIYVMNADGSNVQKVTKPLIGVFYLSPAWDSTGTKIALSSNVEDRTAPHTDFDIYVLTVSTGHMARLTFAGGLNGQPSWSPDGRRIAFQSNRDGNFQIYVINADGTGEMRLSQGSADDLTPSWQPARR